MPSWWFISFRSTTGYSTTLSLETQMSSKCPSSRIDFCCKNPDIRTLFEPMMFSGTILVISTLWVRLVKLNAQIIYNKKTSRVMVTEEMHNIHSLINQHLQTNETEDTFWSIKIYFAHQLVKKMNYKEFYTKIFSKELSFSKRITQKSR